MPRLLLDFDAPRFLLLIALLLPLVVVLSRHSLSRMSGPRRYFTTGLRMLVALLLIACLAEPQWKMLHDRLAVIFLVDQSDSIQPEEQQRALEYVSNAVGAQRRAERDDHAGLIAFGREAAVEMHPSGDSWWLERLEVANDPRFTNLAAAMRLAEAVFPPDFAKRVVIVSDGNENIGSARVQAEHLLRAGIGIDVVPINYRRTGDVAVEKVVAPNEVLPSTPFELRVVLNNASPDRPTSGKLQITQAAEGRQQLLTEQDVTLPPGKRVFSIRQEIERAGFFTYEAIFMPDAPESDTFTANNRAAAYSQVRGKARILLIENAEQRGRFDSFVDLLRRQQLEVTVRDSSQPYSGLADLQQFDSVILADVPRVSGAGADQLSQFSDEQIRALVQNTEQFGCGLVVLGGENSYGAGGWANTELEEALPVDFEIKNAKVQAVGALVLVMDKSGSMSGEKIKWCKAAAAASAKMLTSRDYLGVVVFDSASRWVTPLARNDNPQAALARIGRIGADGGTDLMPGMQDAYRAMNRVQASVKHVIVLTDGQTPPAGHVALAQQMRQQGITVSGVAVGPDADRALLADIATQGGGKFYHVNDPRAIPRIFMRETRRVAMPLIYEKPEGFTPQITGAGEIISGIEGPVPPITGYVLTTLKQNPLVEVMLRAPNQAAGNDTLLATWQNGLGRCAVLTTDIGHRWASSWPEWRNYEKLLLQTVRWSLRTSRGDTELRMESDYRDDAIHVTVTAMDKSDALVNFLTLSGNLVDAEGDVHTFAMEQVAPGRYVARLPVGEPGNYHLAVAAAGEAAPLRTAVFVPDTAEFARLESNDLLLAELASIAPEGGEAGRVIRSEAGLDDTESLLQTDLFRSGVAPAEQRRPIWPWLLAATCFVFLGDVFFRRVALPPGMIASLRERLRRRDSQTEEEAPAMQRLKQTKADMHQRWEIAENASRLAPDAEPSHTEPEAGGRRTEAAAPAAAAPDKAFTPEAADAEGSYTDRLLRAKRDARGKNQRRD